jgi:predicted AAA+ superfamily ATPase
MSKIRQALLRHQQGYSIRKIAETLGGISKNTINNYINQKERLGCPIEDLLSLSDPELEKKFHQGNGLYGQTHGHVPIRTAILQGRACQPTRDPSTPLGGV